MTNTQLLYSQHVENVRHDRATEAAKQADIENTRRQLDIQQEYNQAQVEINRLKLAQDKAIADVKAALESRNLDQQQENNLRNWLINAQKASSDIARNAVQNERDRASIDSTVAKAVQETPLGYLAVKGSTKLFESLPGAQELVDSLWPMLSDITGIADPNSSAADYIVQDYSDETKLDIANKVTKLLEGSWFAKDLTKPYTLEEFWRRAAPKSEVKTWDSWTKEQKNEIFQTNDQPWGTSYWKQQYSRYRSNWPLYRKDSAALATEAPPVLPG